MFCLQTHLKLSGFLFDTADHRFLFLAECVGKTHSVTQEFHSLSLGSQRYLKEMTVSHSGCRSIASKIKEKTLLDICMKVKFDDNVIFTLFLHVSVTL